MKESRYNYYVNRGDKTICLNGISGKVFSMNKDEYSFLKKILNNSDLQKEKPTLTKWLLEKRFLVNSHSEEIDYIKYLNRKSVNSKYYNLVINPTQECNFNCWYCYENHLRGFMNEEVRSNVLSHIDFKLRKANFEQFSLSWFGGEPLLYFKKIVYPLSLYAKEKCLSEDILFSNSITTNGFLINEKLIGDFEQIDLRHFQITLDGNPETHNKIRNQKGTPSFDRIIRNCIYLCEQLTGSSITLRINYTDESIKTRFAEVLDIIPVNCRSHIAVQFQRVWQTYSSENVEGTTLLLERNENELKENGFRVSYNQNFSIFKGHVCYADRKNYAHINYDGNVYRCTARDYIPENALGKLMKTGEIEWVNEEMNQIDAKPYFETPLCMACDYLPLCGGPCFQKAMDALNTSQNVCVKDLLDSTVESFVINHYDYIKKCNKVLI